MNRLCPFESFPDWNHVRPFEYLTIGSLHIHLNSLLFESHKRTAHLRIVPDRQVVADLLMTLTIAVKVLSDAGVGSWRLRAFHCRYSAVLFYSTMYISILLLGLISLDRYLKIVRPFGKSALQRVGVGQALCTAVWVVVTALALPNVVLSNRAPVPSGGVLKCSSLKEEAGLRWHEGFNYFCQVRSGGVRWGPVSVAN